MKVCVNESQRIHCFALVISLGLMVSAMHGAESNFGFSRAINPQWLPDDSRQWSRVDESELITDLTQASPSSALTTGRREPGKWKVLPFETDSFKGNALSVYMNTEPPAVEVSVNKQGWHAVYIGISTTSGGITKASKNGVRVKISGDPSYRRMATELPLVKPRRDVIQEQFLDVYDLQATDRVIIAPMHNLPATVTYIRLVPLTKNEVTLWQKDRRESRFKTSIFTFDGGSWIWPYQPRSAADLKEAFRGMETSDAGKWWFEIGADQVYYPSKIGTLRFDGVLDYHLPLRKDHAESIRWLLANDINPLQVARDAAKEQGREFHVIMRPGAWAAGYPFEEIFASKFYDDHPEWRCVDYEGKRTMYMSYAVPEVRQHVVALLKEAVEMVDPDGVGFIFTRGMPMVLFEPAFRKEFKAVYDEDPLDLDEEDPRIYQMRARIIDQLMNEVRTMLDEVAVQRGGKRYEISAGTFSNEEGNRRFGFDVRRWVEEQWVDDLVIAVNAHFVRAPGGGAAMPDMHYYNRLVKGSDVGVYPLVLSVRTGSSAEHVARLLGYWKDGADGIAVWDPVVEGHGPTSGTPTRYSGNNFDLFVYMGHSELLAYWQKHGYPTVRRFSMRRLGDNTYSKWYPNSGY
tara:strand:- start:97934 stop:99823 length:1890 start_codon:yes stop_codon:yes gene_type:complete